MMNVEPMDAVLDLFIDEDMANIPVVANTNTKEMVVALVDKEDIDVGVSQCLGSAQPAEPATNNQDTNTLRVFKGH